MEETPDTSAPPKHGFMAKIIALLSLPVAAALGDAMIPGKDKSILLYIALYLALLMLSLLVALVLKFAAGGLWARTRKLFFLAWMSGIPIAILIGMLFTALLHWGGPPD